LSMMRRESTARPSQSISSSGEFHESRVAMVIIGALVLSVLGIVSGASATECQLTGNSITIDIVTCPNRETNIGPDCTRGRVRYGVLKDSVLEFADEITPRGIVYELGRTVDVTEHMNDDAIPGTYTKAIATASYSSGQLRLLKKRERYLKT